MANQTLNRMGKQVIKLAAKLALKLDVQFQTPLPSGAKIIAPNHPTTMDPFIISTITNEPVYILVTESAFKMPLVGRYLRAAGHIPVVTGSGRDAFEAAK
ncbi:MAG TPA: 1-acyl-sn-glycerol-3-phosphate acyltransferase, partial [Phototrophicaceae bacterium]|nr:1-acyl-sn-glycerol-3-phosphate acyltransferase [Phototrophicaceae bacterium]